METATYSIKFMEILNIDWNCASTQMASILSICDCTSVYVFLCSFVKFCFNKNVCYYYLNCFICFGALFMAQNVCYYYLNCFICFGALFMAHPVYYSTGLGGSLIALHCQSIISQYFSKSNSSFGPINMAPLPELIGETSSFVSTPTHAYVLHYRPTLLSKYFRGEQEMHFATNLVNDVANSLSYGLIEV